MRRRTALGVGAVLAGTLVFGAGGTVAALSDTASMSAEAGAGSLSLSGASASSGRLQLQLGRTATIPLRAQTDGGEGVVLQVSVVGEPGSAPCPTGAALTIGVPSGAGLPATDLCGLGSPVTFLRLDGTADAVDLPLTVTATGSATGQASSASWDGSLRFTLRHAHGGFSDHQDVEVHVVTPPGQGGGNPGNGRNDRSTSSAATAGAPAAQAATEQPSDVPVGASTSAEAETTSGSGAVVDEPVAPSDADGGAVVEQPATPAEADAGGAEPDAAETGAGSGAPDPAGVSAP